ncbi:hypothetical protein LINGRAHAP2_LOCUS18501 [Linum grandiflorum]
MYGADITTPRMVQIFVLQIVVWCSVLLLLFEYRTALMVVAADGVTPMDTIVVAGAHVEDDITTAEILTAAMVSLCTENH